MWKSNNLSFLIILLQANLFASLVLETSNNSRNLQTFGGGIDGDGSLSTLQQFMVSGPSDASPPAQFENPSAMLLKQPIQIHIQSDGMIPQNPPVGHQKQQNSRTLLRFLQPSFRRNPKSAPSAISNAETTLLMPPPPPSTSSATVKAASVVPSNLASINHQEIQQQWITPLRTPTFTSATTPLQPIAQTHSPPPSQQAISRLRLTTLRSRTFFKHQKPRGMANAQVRSMRPKVLRTQAVWPIGDYCIMPGNSGICPQNFAIGSVGFAIPIIIKSHQMYRDGGSYKRYVELGKIGGFDISIPENSHNIYKISLTACCRLRTP